MTHDEAAAESPQTAASLRDPLAIREQAHERPIDEGQASMRSIRRRLMGWTIGSLIVSGLMFLLTLFFGSLIEPPWLGIPMVMTGLILTGIAANLWMTLAAIGTALVFGPRWDWQLIQFGPLAGIPLLLGLASDADGVAMWLMSIVILFLATQLFYLATIGVRRMQGYRLVHRTRSGHVSGPIAVKLQWMIVDLMMTTTLVAAGIASLGWSYRTLQDNEGLFGPFFGLVIISILGGMGFVVFLVAMLPALLISMNRDTSQSHKVTRLAAHVVFCFSCWLILAAISVDAEFAIYSLLALAGITFGNLVIQPKLFGDQSKWFPFGLTRVRDAEPDQMATNPPSPEA